MRHYYHTILPAMLVLAVLLYGCNREPVGHVLESRPSGAGVWCGETLVAHTPMRLLETGEERAYILRLAGFEPLEVKISAVTTEVHSGGDVVSYKPREGGELVAEVVLHAVSRATHSLRCISIPEGAEVLLDGEPRGVSPLEIKGLERRPYQLTFQMKDRETVTHSVVWKEGESVRTVEATLPSMTVAFYRGKLSSEPLNLLHYADLGHQLVLEGRLDEAVSLYKSAIDMILDGKASENANRLWSEVNRVIVVQYVYGDASVIRSARTKMLEMLRQVFSERDDIANQTFFISYIDCAESLNQHEDAQEKFTLAWRKWPNSKPLRPYLKRGFTK